MLRKRPRLSVVGASRPAAQKNVAGRGPKLPRLTAAQVGAGAMRFLRHIYGGQSVLFIMLLVFTVAIVGFGLVMMLSASSIESLKTYNSVAYIFWRQFGIALFGIVALTFASLAARLVRKPKAVAWFFLGALAVQFYTIAFGVNVNGNRQWFRVFNIQFQPSEFLKLAVILVLALVISSRYDGIYDKRYFLLPALVAPGITLAAILGGSDLGTSIIVGGFVLAMLWLAGAPLKQLGAVAGAAAVGAVVLSRLGNRGDRISSWLSADYSQDSGQYAWQATHGVWALANGHIGGVGLGMSTLKWSWLPEAQNDYIFAIIGEELGMGGALFTIALFVALVICIFKVGMRASDMFGRMVCFGIGSWFLLQSVINIAVVLGVLPVLGVPLPLVSSGGSAMVSGLAAIGVVLGIERQNFMDIERGVRAQLHLPFAGWAR